MLVDFFTAVRKAGVPCTLREWLDLVAALAADVTFASMDDFYVLARTVLVKDEAHYDRFDRAFAAYFKGIESVELDVAQLIPREWLLNQWQRWLTEEERQQLQQHDNLQELMEKLYQRLREQKERHAGGNKWIGTGGTSPFGAYGDHPQGIRIGQDGNRRHSAVKVWDQRLFRDLDGDATLGIRQIQMALRRLRQFARDGAADELDLEHTIRATARQAGMLDLQMRAERHNAVKVLLFFDIGGSMDPYVQLCEELFSACRTEFKHLEYFYFHNCIYESVWKTNMRRQHNRTELEEIWRTYDADYKVIIIGDASMAPWEVTHPGGSVEHFNQEAGSVWLQRLKSHFRKVVWLNPMGERYWDYTESLVLIRQLMEGHMYPLSLSGVEEAIHHLSR